MDCPCPRRAPRKSSRALSSAKSLITNRNAKRDNVMNVSLQLARPVSASCQRGLGLWDRTKQPRGAGGSAAGPLKKAGRDALLECDPKFHR